MSEPAREPSDLASAFVEDRPALERFIARRVRCQQTAQDLASEVYLRLDRVVDFSGTREDARRYLYRVAANIAIDHVKIAGRRVAIIDENLVHFETMTESAEAAIIERQQLGIVADAMEELPDRYREILLLSRHERLTHREIAERLGISVSLVEKTIMRSIRHCRDRVREAGEIDEAGAGAAVEASRR
ncbi:RNA polymerase sigma factor [Sphingomonas colocasiae]|uniref:RNA polymerase sigma factor n=1 Tax=Sphingomonas colocasiae TaxID=1848973 RepID=A0ABS7PQ90_9SPHN|nr:RNA polymerase sigma factor [Sphingomonas colocasiae]